MAIDTSIYFGRLGCMIHHYHYSIEDNSFQIQQFWVLLLFECPEKKTWNILGTSTGCIWGNSQKWFCESCGKHTGEFFVERSVKTQDFLWEILYPVVKNMGTSIQRINTGYRTDSKVIEKEQIFLPLEEFENLEFDIFIFFW